jgi:1,4-dihydroxy-2-naphthoyl-CoA hydrolase
MTEQPMAETLRDMGNTGYGGSLGEQMGLVITEASPERVVGTMPVSGNTQPYGLWHGGASCVLAESLGSVGAALHAKRLHGGTSVGIEISATHHRGISTGSVTGVATPVHLGRQIATYDIVISDDQGRRICTSRLTCMLRQP